MQLEYNKFYKLTNKLINSLNSLSFEDDEKIVIVREEHDDEIVYYYLFEDTYSIKLKIFANSATTFYIALVPVPKFN